ncbi:hypothetical protein PN462_14450 [Spirulina sp. CS-785/01]|uniref:hypothetical protein n=1 Tax=Spirulina sp. CS-785/01 TaxID=3021716 RepID=UPI00232CE247|nr:hypothetical protein [Spirulina sp. CS-785/01]MDB9314311.1 hypothetical protein [Spirulina sp. CS-785/01]
MRYTAHPVKHCSHLLLGEKIMFLLYLLVGTVVSILIVFLEFGDLQSVEFFKPVVSSTVSTKTTLGQLIDSFNLFCNVFQFLFNEKKSDKKHLIPAPKGEVTNSFGLLIVFLLWPLFLLSAFLRFILFSNTSNAQTKKYINATQLAPFKIQNIQSIFSRTFIKLKEPASKSYSIYFPIRLSNVTTSDSTEKVTLKIIGFCFFEDKFRIQNNDTTYEVGKLYSILQQANQGQSPNINLNSDICKVIILPLKHPEISNIFCIKKMCQEIYQLEKEKQKIQKEAKNIRIRLEEIKTSEANKDQIRTFKNNLNDLKQSYQQINDVYKAYFNCLKEYVVLLHKKDTRVNRFQVQEKIKRFDLKTKYRQLHQQFNLLPERHKSIKNNINKKKHHN